MVGRIPAVNSGGTDPDREAETRVRSVEEMIADAQENPSIRLARAVLHALTEQGVRWVAYCPGSRDAPFGYVLSEMEREGWINTAAFSDERSAGFWAVGAARATSEPVAVVTTSGTAATELHPALEEAWFQSLPIVAITADRPHEMRGVGASQTTHQVGIFGRSVVTSAELPADISYDDGVLPRVRGRVRRMVAAAKGFLGQAGPVHLNVAFREPLVPSREKAGAGAGERVETAEQARQSFPEKGQVHFSPVRHPGWDEIVDRDLRTLVVAGDGADRAVATAAARRGLPIVAEPTANVADLDTWIPYEQWLVPDLGELVEQIVVLGRPTLSRPVTQLLAQPRIRKVVVATHPEWVDVHETVDVVVAGLADESEDRRVAESPAVPTVRNRRSGTAGVEAVSSDGWLAVWRRAAEAVDRVLGDDAIGEEKQADSLSLLAACRAIWHGSDAALLWLGASNTVRGFDLVANRPGRGAVHSNRGLAGIDGTIASALGLAMAENRPVRAVMGDMTFAYDLSTLAQRPEPPNTKAPDIQVIVLDDAGGSIFASLEHGEAEPDVYERFFAVAPHVDPVQAARACGWQARRIATLAELRDALAAPIGGRSLLHVRIPRPAAQLDAARNAARQAVGGVLDL
ncbi:2-succinyl-5-enolpyruvyl-6-hydroxy-3-cyclohexene-1-carboxylic-acid synthase [Actinomycetaceae bacterium L2_0104]